MDNKLATLKAVLEIVNKDYITRDDFTAAFKAVSTAVNVTRDTLTKQITDKLATVKDGQTPTDNELRALIKPLIPKVQDGKTPTNAELLALIRPLIPEPIGDARLLSLIEPLIPPPIQGSPDMAEDIRNKLELLQGDERLDASAIRNLPEFTKETAKGVLTASALYSLADVDVAGIVSGQSIKWDGIRWIPYTPAGANTAVYNEVISGSGTTFTLAHTPVSGTVRVYANGQRLVPTTDYTISSATITTVSTWSANSITADYEY